MTSSVTCGGISLAAQKPITLKFVSKVHTVYPCNYSILSATADYNYQVSIKPRKENFKAATYNSKELNVHYRLLKYISFNLKTGRSGLLICILGLYKFMY